MKKHLEDFQDMEFKRIQKLKELLEIYVRSQEQLVASYQSSVAEVKKAIGSINDKKDIDTFVLTNKTNLVPEELVQYEAYQSQVSPRILTKTNFFFAKGISSREILQILLPLCLIV